MKAHNHIDDMFQQHFAEANVPMDNQEALWQRIAARKDNDRGGFLWFGLLGLAFCVVAGFTIINSNNHIDQNLLSNNIVATADYITPNNSENSQTAFAEIKEEKDEVINTPSKSSYLSPVEPESNRLKNIRSISSINEEKDAELKNVEKLTPERNASIEVDESYQNNQNAFYPERNRVANKSSISKLPLKNLVIENTTLSNNTPPTFNQSDSWSKCEVKTPGHFFVDVYGQGGLSMDEIGFTQTGSDQTTYRDLWNERFDPKASWHGGAQIGYEMQNGLRISAGVEYQELVTQYSDNQRITETIRVWDPQAFFTIDPNTGDRVWQGDTVTAINIYDRKFVRKNIHTLFHIPVQLSYDIYKKPGFHIAVDASAALNISKTYEGQFIRSDQTLIMIDESNQDNYISKDIGISFSAGLHFGKYLNDNWEVYASPRFRYNPNSYLLDSETLKITRNLVGLRAGLRYHF